MGEEAPPPSPPLPRRWTWVLAGLGGLIVVFLLAAAGILWLGQTTGGLTAACTLAQPLSGGRLFLAPESGTLAGPLRLREAVWRDQGITVRLTDVDFDWSPAALLHGRLDIARLAAGSLQLTPGPAKAQAAPPASLRLPLAVRIAEIRVGRLERDGRLLAEDLSGRLESDGGRHRLSALQARVGQVSLAGEAELAGDAPFGLSARVVAASRLEGHAFSLDLRASGRLAAIDIAGQAGGALRGSLSALATPFRPQPFQRLQIHLQGIDPSAWLSGAPAARVDVDADLLPKLAGEWTVGGPFSAVNREPGPLSARRLPIARLAGRVDWQGGTARFTGLQATLPGGGSLAGRGQLAGRELALDLRADRLDAALLHPRLRPTRLAGSLDLRAGPAEQSVAVDLADPRFRLAARLRRRGDEVEAESLRLTAGPARLEARGRLALNPAYPFTIQGKLARFDPSRFARVPAASLNADFEAAGRLQPKVAAKLHFDLRDSRFRDQPLAGRGDVDLEWPAVHRAEVFLAAGPNRLEAHGAFGHPGDRLDIAVDAPDLAPYGAEGGVSGRLQLTGTPAAPAVSGQVRADRLGLPGSGRVEGLEAEGEAGPKPEDPLRLDLRCTALDLPGRADAAREVAVQVRGSRARHELRGSAVLAGNRRLALAASGGLAEGAGAPAWSGRLDQFAVTAAEPGPGLRLLQPAPLRLGADGWALGPAEIAGSEWRGRFQASAAGGRLEATADGQGPRLGKIDAYLEARLEGAWKLAQAAPWQGRLVLSAADIAWLGPLLGEDWRTAGQLQGELRLAGTPARPRVTGEVRGGQLGLAIPAQGFRLENGSLQAELTGDRLQIATLAFDSRLRPPPRPLLRLDGEVAGLAATPGRLEIRGEIELGGAGRAGGLERGFLDLRLERVGVLQQADQWVAVSGDGRLRWQGTELAAEAKVRADAGYWELARLGLPRLSDDVVVHRSGGEAREPAARPRLELDIEADLGPRFHFSGDGLESRLAGSIRLRSSGRDLPRATGTIRTVEGKFDAYGQKLVVERGIINFQGFLDNPTLNVRAVRKGLPVEPGVEVTGPVKKPVVRLVSDPELPEAEKLSWLVLGHGSEQLAGGDASTLLGAASALLGRDSSGGALQQIQRRLGIEEFGVRQGQIGDIDSRQPTSRVAGATGFGGMAPGTPVTAGGQIVTVSKRLSSNVLLSYEQAMGRAENIVKLTVNLSRRLSVVGRAGSDNAIDLFYTFSFGK